MKNILVLGCGPSGLIAAHAATLLGHAVIIASKKRKSELYGAQYLHRPIVAMTDTDPVDVEYLMSGTAAEYREKVYGKTSRVRVSPETLETNHQAWDIRRTYDNLWERYGPDVQDINLGKGDDLEEILNGLQPDRIYSTVPAPLLCHNDSHSFRGEEVWAIGDAPERGLLCPVKIAPNTILCDGTRDVSWYRASNVFGYSTAEWPGEKKPPIENISKIVKPLSTDCDCHPFIARIGRYGKWTKGVLSHEAWGDVLTDMAQEMLF